MATPGSLFDIHSVRHFVACKQVGRWTVILENHGESTTSTQLLVTSKSPTVDSYPIRTRAFLSQHNIDFNGMTITTIGNYYLGLYNRVPSFHKSYPNQRVVASVEVPSHNYFMFTFKKGVIIYLFLIVLIYLAVNYFKTLSI